MGIKSNLVLLAFMLFATQMVSASAMDDKSNCTPEPVAQPPSTKPIVEPPVQPPVKPPIAQPPSTKPVVAPPVQPPVKPPVAQPPSTKPVVAPPVQPPVKPPVAQPPSTKPVVTPPVQPPVAEPPSTKPIVEPPETTQYPPITSRRGRAARCFKYCSTATKGKRVCFRNCTACADKYLCVPVDMECKAWNDIERYGKVIMCP